MAQMPQFPNNNNNLDIDHEIAQFQNGIRIGIECGRAIVMALAVAQGQDQAQLQAQAQAHGGARAQIQAQAAHVQAQAQAEAHAQALAQVRDHEAILGGDIGAKLRDVVKVELKVTELKETVKEMKEEIEKLKEKGQEPRKESAFARYWETKRDEFERDERRLEADRKAFEEEKANFEKHKRRRLIENDGQEVVETEHDEIQRNTEAEKTDAGSRKRWFNKTLDFVFTPIEVIKPYDRKSLQSNLEIPLQQQLEEFRNRMMRRRGLILEEDRLNATKDENSDGTPLERKETEDNSLATDTSTNQADNEKPSSSDSSARNFEDESETMKILREAQKKWQDYKNKYLKGSESVDQMSSGEAAGNSEESSPEPKKTKETPQ